MSSRRPPALVLVVALLVPVLGMLPTWQGYHFQSPPDRVFMGFRYMAADHFQYAALIRQAQYEGRFLMENRYTTEPQKRVYLFLYYWLLGSVARVTGASLVGVWELFRWVGGALYIVIFWRMTAHYFQDDRRRLLATLVFSFAGGVDWVVTALRAMGLSAVAPLEYPFSYYWNWCTFGTMLVPNWIWPAMIWMVVCLALLGRSRWRDLVTFVLPPVIWLVHHHTALVVYLTLGVLPVIPLAVAAARLQPLPWARFRSNLRIALPGLLSFGTVAVYLIWARSDQVFRLNAEASFNWTVFFSVWWYPLSYGLLLPLAWFGIKDLSSKEGLSRDLLFAWLAASFFLSVNPLEGGAKYQYLMFPPISLLAVRGMGHLTQHSPGVRRLLSARSAVVLFALPLFLNAPVSLVKDMHAVRTDPDIYASRGEIDAMKWLAGQPDGAVLSSYRTGHLIPWLAGKKVYIGHWFMTLDLSEKAANVSYFFRPEVPTAMKKEFLRKTGTTYVFFGPNEAAMGSMDPALSLEKVYDADAVRIFRVPPSS